MADLKFLLSNPPHADPDPAAAAGVFGLSTAEARIKLNFAGPDVWFAGEDSEDLEAKVADLRQLGARVSITDAAAVADLSKRLTLRRFAFGDRKLELETGGGETLAIPYDWSAIAVVCRPMQRETIDRKTVRQAARAASPNKSHRQQARMSLSDAKTQADESFVDLYFTDGTNVHRVTIRPGTVDYSSLGDAKAVTERENLVALIAELGNRFDNLIEDRRLENAPAPHITLLGNRTLRGHLETVDPSLKDVDDYDLMSRFAFISAR